MSGNADDVRMQLARLAPGPGGAAPSPGYGAMQTELQGMLDFKKDIDRLIDEHLSSSPADPQKMAQEEIPPTALGTGFAEATGLHAAYKQVHDELTGLSRLLSGQINALSTAILASKNGYESIDLATREQMLAIQSESQMQYQPALDPNAEAHGRTGTDPGSAQPAADKRNTAPTEAGSGDGEF